MPASKGRCLWTQPLKHHKGCSAACSVSYTIGKMPRVCTGPSLCTDFECFCVSWQVREYMNRVVRAESEASRAKVEAVRVSEALQRADQDIQASAEQSPAPMSSLSAIPAGNTA